MAGSPQSTSPLSWFSRTIPHCNFRSELISQTRSRDRSHLLFSLTPLRSDTLAIPALLSATSAFFLLVRYISTCKLARKLFKAEGEEEFEPTAEEIPRGWVTKLRHHAVRCGGITIFVYRILRLLAVLGLVGLTTLTIVLGNKDAANTTHDRTQVLNWSVLAAYVCSP